MRTAIYPGSFDPVTNGHLDVIKRAATVFDKLIVAVLVNANKKPTFSAEERVEFIKKVIPEIEGCEIEVMHFDGLLADFAEQVGATEVVKGLRAVSDFEYEFQMALLNRQMNPKLDTMFFMTSAKYMYLSSSVVREIGHLGGDISGFVPPQILETVQEKLRD